MRRHWTGIVAAVAVGAIGASLYAEWTSLERGNRRYRAGVGDDAVDLYQPRALAEDAPGIATYNLGTALLGLGDQEAEATLRAATRAGNRVVAQRSNYNLGFLFLSKSLEVPARDSALVLLAAAVSSTRMALRLDPADANARLNLALAQHLYDSLSQALEAEPPKLREESRQQEGEGVVLPELGQLSGRRRVEREAEAGDDPGSLSEAEARALLSGVSTDVEALIRSILWSRRPDVRPWMEPYPGGAW